MPSRQSSTRTDRREDASADLPTDLVSIAFNYRDVAYTVDLDPGEAAEFDAAIAPYIAAAHRVGGSRARRQPS